MTSRARDAYYTPRWLADEVISAIPDGVSGAVLDPAAGEGALLSAAERRFGARVRPVAIDVDRAVARRLAQEHRDWVVSCANFLDERSMKSSLAWRSTQTSLGAVVLNPPFSYRGNAGQLETFGPFTGRVTPALHFLVVALRSFAPSHGFVAIMPNGALDAERNVGLWQQISREYLVERLQSPSTSSFSGARVATTVVRIQKQAAGISSVPFSQARTPNRIDILNGCRCVEVVRGRVPVHRVSEMPRSPADVPFLHTTSFRDFDRASRQLAPAHLSDEAPLVCVPRVGRWHPPLSLEVGRVVLSDCVIGIRPRSPGNLKSLQELLTDNEASILSGYRGTGAPYLTLASLIRTLQDIGLHAHVVKAGSPAGACCCPAVVGACNARAG